MSCKCCDRGFDDAQASECREVPSPVWNHVFKVPHSEIMLLDWVRYFKDGGYNIEYRSRDSITNQGSAPYLPTYHISFEEGATLELRNEVELHFLPTSAATVKVAIANARTLMSPEIWVDGKLNRAAFYARRKEVYAEEKTLYELFELSSQPESLSRLKIDTEFKELYREKEMAYYLMTRFADLYEDIRLITALTGKDRKEWSFYAPWLILPTP